MRVLAPQLSPWASVDLEVLVAEALTNPPISGAEERRGVTVLMMVGAAGLT